MRGLYDTPLWQVSRRRALARDGARCTVARLLGGDCTDTLHVHHLVRPEHGGARYQLDNLVTVCSAHHPMLEAIRRRALDAARPGPAPRCPHQHRSAEARRQCEARLARQRAAA